MTTLEVLGHYWKMKESGDIREAEKLLLNYVEHLDRQVDALVGDNDVDPEHWNREWEFVVEPL